MRVPSLFAIAMQAGLAFSTGSQAQAAGRFGSDSDVIGLRLTMTGDEATKFVTDNYPDAPITVIPVSVSTDKFQKQATAGFIADLIAKDDSAANQKTTEQLQKEFDARKAAGFGDGPLNKAVGSVGDFAHDRVKILFNPNDGATDIFSVSRYTEYTKGKQPVTATFVSALTEKYGPPTVSAGNIRSTINYTWLAPGVLERTRTSLTQCHSESGFDFLYEDVGESGFYGMPTLVNSTAENFARTVNLIHNKNPNRNYAACGTILQVRLIMTPDGDYVGSMSARLIDLSRAYKELGQFGDAFWAQASGARQQQLGKDSAIKPKL